MLPLLKEKTFVLISNVPGKGMASSRNGLELHAPIASNKNSENPTKTLKL
jgi:hypothetical protein